MGVWFSKLYVIARDYRGELTIGLLCFVLASLPEGKSRTVTKRGNTIRPLSGHLQDTTALAQKLCFQVRVYNVSVLSQVAV